MPYKNILIVEDDRDIRECVKDLLELEGYKVQTAENGKVALDALTHMNDACLILLDLNMPVMNGAEFLAAANERHVVENLYVVILTAQAERATGLKADQVITKPTNVETILDVVQEHCAKPDSTQQAA